MPMMTADKIKIAICDDDSLLLTDLSQQVENLFSNQNLTIEISLYTSGRQLIEEADNSYDLYFLDIEMPDISGMELASYIRRAQENAALVFVSSHEQMVFESIHHQPLRFLRKSHLHEELSEAIDAFLLFYQKHHRHLELHTISGDSIIPLSELMYIESSKHYLNFNCTKECIKIRGNLSDYIETLSTHHFVLTTKGVLVNCTYIKNITNTDVVLVNDVRLGLARGNKENVKEKYLKCLREKLYGTA